MYEEFKNHNKKEGFFSKIFFSLICKTLVVILLFVSTMIYVKDNSKNKNIIKKVVYQNTISFAKIYSMYKDYLGDAIPFKGSIKDETKMVSDDKLTYKEVKKDGNGYLFEVSELYSLSSITSGIVVEITKDEKYYNIIKIQDKNGLGITYGYLQDINVKLYDYVQKGQILGICNNKLYMIFQKDDKYLSYEEYI